MMQKLLVDAAIFCTCCSVASILMPPIETFSHFPRFHNYYAVAVIIVTRWGSLNLRNSIYWQQFDTTRPDLNSMKGQIQ
jgi:hypothetical protein